MEIYGKGVDSSIKNFMHEKKSTISQKSVIRYFDNYLFYL